MIFLYLYLANIVKIVKIVKKQKTFSLKNITIWTENRKKMNSNSPNNSPNSTNIHVHLEKENGNSDISVSYEKFQKMLFLSNALNDGWSIKKRKDSYIFTKNHEGKKEVLEDSYLLEFMKKNMNFNDLLK